MSNSSKKPEGQDFTYEVNSDAIVSLMRKKGMTKSELAAKAPISPATLRSVLSSKRRAHMCTLRKIAKALETEPQILIKGDQSQDVGFLEEPWRARAQVQLTTKFEKFDETSDLQAVIQVLQHALATKRIVYVLAIDPGSVRITFDMSMEDALKLDWIFRDGSLKQINRIAIESVTVVLPKRVKPSITNIAASLGPLPPASETPRGPMPRGTSPKEDKQRPDTSSSNEDPNQKEPSGEK